MSFGEQAIHNILLPTLRTKSMNKPADKPNFLLVSSEPNFKYFFNTLEKLYPKTVSIPYVHFKKLISHDHISISFPNKKLRFHNQKWGLRSRLVSSEVLEVTAFIYTEAHATKSRLLNFGSVISVRSIRQIF